MGSAIMLAKFFVRSNGTTGINFKKGFEFPFVHGEDLVATIDGDSVVLSSMG